ncbi:amine oxidase, partial [Pseudomonas sp. MWU13-2860]
FFQQLGGEVRLESSVSNIVSKGEGFEFQVKGRTIAAKSLILAMPRRALELLSATSPWLQESARFKELIASVTPRPLFKLFTTYNSPWWLNTGYNTADGDYVPVKSGRSVTDLPIRQTYYWPRSNGQPALHGHAMLLASYDDGDNTGFWDGLRGRRHSAWKEGKEVAELTDAFI